MKSKRKKWFVLITLSNLAHRLRGPFPDKRTACDYVTGKRVAHKLWGFEVIDAQDVTP